MERFGQNFMGFGLFNVGLRVLKKYSTELFYSTEPLGQHCRGFFPVQLSSKNINAILNRLFLLKSCLEPLGQHCIGSFFCTILFPEY